MTTTVKQVCSWTQWSARTQTDRQTAERDETPLHFDNDIILYADNDDTTTLLPVGRVQSSTTHSVMTGLTDRCRRQQAAAAAAAAQRCCALDEDEEPRYADSQLPIHRNPAVACGVKHLHSIFTRMLNHQWCKRNQDKEFSRSIKCINALMLLANWQFLSKYM